MNEYVIKNIINGNVCTMKTNRIYSIGDPFVHEGISYTIEAII